MMERSRVLRRAFMSQYASIAVLLGIVVAGTLCCGSAGASIRRHHHPVAHTFHPIAHTFLALTDPGKDAALIADGETGRPLYARNADALRHPASLTKMMTLYLLFEQLKNGQMTLATPLYVSEHAAVQARTKLNLRPGTSIPVDTAIKAIVVLSANDVAVTIAEAIGGTESHFAELMTAKARALGMTHTYYDNASGLPDPLQITSASDLVILARHLAYDFPQYFRYFSTYSFGYRGATYFTHDNLIGRYQGTDGIKTGYTGASGFNLVSSVVRNGVHIIGVVMGGVTARRRDSEMVRLLDDTFASIAKNPRLAARESIPWTAIASNTETKPVIAGFALGSQGTVPPAAPSASQILLPAPPPATADDEDAAESRPDTAYQSLAGLPGAVTPSPVSELPKAAPMPAGSAAFDLSPPNARRPASYAPAPPHSELKAPTVESRAILPRPEPKPSMELADYQPLPLAARNDNAPPAAAVGHLSPGAVGKADWTIQIGAFDDAASAREELAGYAGRATDVLGQAARIVAPIQSAEGHILYRARFGPFVEHEAREVCQLLTVRGETCFAALATRE
jgi:D-alanyl-D-alanine carboxypeptidase